MKKHLVLAALFALPVSLSAVTAEEAAAAAAAAATKTAADAAAANAGKGDTAAPGYFARGKGIFFGNKKRTAGTVVGLAALVAAGYYVATRNSESEDCAQ